jgi:hypothetical protein
MEVRVPDIPLIELVRKIDNDKLVVPEFQRGFKWKATDVRKLLESILLDYPIGSALLWRTHRSAFEYRRIQDVELADDNGAEETGHSGVVEESANETDFILDGQQRITSIYKMFPARLSPAEIEIDSHLKGLRFFIALELLGLPTTLDEVENLDLEKNEEPDALSAAIVEKTHIELKKDWKRLNSVRAAPNILSDEQILTLCTTKNWLPVTRGLLENKTAFLQRLTRVVEAKLLEQAKEKSGSPGSIDQSGRITNAIERWMDWFTSKYVGTLNAKMFPCLVLSNERPDGLARIFETINSTGMGLTVFDLLVARIGSWEESGNRTNVRSKIQNGLSLDLLQSFDDGKSLGGAATQQLPRALALKNKLELKKG